jgi:cell division topological specificity factor
MNLLRFFTWRRAPVQTAPAARERLQILLTHERSSGTQPDLVAMLREEILTAIGKHVKIDADKVEVSVERGAAVSTLEIEVEVPVVGTRDRADQEVVAQEAQQSGLHGPGGRRRLIRHRIGSRSAAYLTVSSSLKRTGMCW